MTPYERLAALPDGVAASRQGDGATQDYIDELKAAIESLVWYLVDDAAITLACRKHPVLKEVLFNVRS